MRCILLGTICTVLLFSGRAVAGASEKDITLTALEAKVQILADRYDSAVTSFADVETALGVTLKVYDDNETTCALPQCQVSKFSTQRAPFKYNVSVRGIARDAQGKVPSSLARDVEITITLDGKDKSLCFLGTKWTTRLTASGWEPLQPFTIDERAWGPGSNGLPDLHLQGFATRRGAAHLTLRGGGMSSIDGWPDRAKLSKLQRQQSCMKTVVIGSSPLDYRRSRGQLNILDADTQAEFDQNQSKLQKVVANFTTASDVNVLDSALGPLVYSVDQPCSATCHRMFDSNLGELAPMSLLLFQMNNNVDSSSPNAFSWIAEHAFLDVTLNSEAAAGLCFSLGNWNTVLTQAGWEALKPFATTRQAYGRFDPKTFNPPNVEVAVSGYATRRGTIYLTLASAGNSAQFLRSPHEPADFDRLQNLNKCLRSVTVGDSLTVEDAYDLANGLPRPKMPH
ncbi:hypothetical protein AEAC466_14970 [Asticcacaulis sp. AC466]|uniref:hypothetical protein n=1 Tax=Asticcacaulis sp. AC466 TaxID=1282362 RepID=UPI0003C3E041|nr:hypothetical protein [Asticcacaulis sp. AC466]ESQ83161.1 hypothetical protein AEAC466_14970 [Asticcacaulis sp. AC466]